MPTSYFCCATTGDNIPSEQRESKHLWTFGWRVVDAPTAHMARPGKHSASARNTDLDQPTAATRRHTDCPAVGAMRWVDVPGYGSVRRRLDMYVR
jgi:hypothetical protein